MGHAVGLLARSTLILAAHPRCVLRNSQRCIVSALLSRFLIVYGGMAVLRSFDDPLQSDTRESRDARIPCGPGLSEEREESLKCPPHDYNKACGACDNNMVSETRNDWKQFAQ